MGMLHEFKKKPSQVKSRYAFFGAIILTLGIGFIWATTLPARFTDIGETVKEASESQAAGAGFSDLVEKARQEIGIEELDTELIETAERSQDEGERRQTTGESYIQMDSGTGALDGLDGWDDSSPPSQKSQVSSARSQEVKKNETARTQATTTSPMVTSEPSTPTVILIGTTTSKKSE